MFLKTKWLSISQIDYLFLSVRDDFNSYRFLRCLQMHFIFFLLNWKFIFRQKMEIYFRQDTSPINEGLIRLRCVVLKF